MAGYFYPAKREQLLEAIHSSFSHPLGPGRAPNAGDSSSSGSESSAPKCFVVPHAGYAYSGPVAAHSYLAAFDYIAASNCEALTAVIIGPNHYGLGSGISLSSAESWETPLGDVPLNTEMAMQIKDGCQILDVESDSHLREHSIEVQLPFLQYISSTAGKKSLSIIPISLMIQDRETCRLLSRAIFQALANSKDNLNIVLGSSDLTHYEPQEVASRKDEKLLKMVQELNVSGMYGSIERMNITACGYGAIATVTFVAKELGSKGANVLRYATSGDVTGDKSSVVGYSAVEFA